MSENKGKPTSVRFSDADWFHPGIPVVVGGAGGIGSWLTFFLARQECKIFLHDFDEVDETNLGGQLYGTNYIGTYKAEAMSDIAKTFCNNESVKNMGKFDDESFASPIMFSAFDSMTARKAMFEKWKAQSNREIFIDGRMLAESGMVFAVLKGREEKYEKELFDDSEVEEQACSLKATSHCGAFIASIMTATFNNYVTNVKRKSNFREVPFKTSFGLDLLMFDVDV